MDPDASARSLRVALEPNVGVVVTDTAGRAWRDGQTDIAIGAAGVLVAEDFAGRVDAHGNPLVVTRPAVADEIAGAAELAQGKLGGRPFAVLRGRADLVLPRGDHGPGAAALVRPEGADLFGFGAREAVVRALAGDPRDRAVFGTPADVEDVGRAVAAVLARADVRGDGDAAGRRTRSGRTARPGRGVLRPRLAGRRVRSGGHAPTGHSVDSARSACPTPGVPTVAKTDKKDRRAVLDEMRSSQQRGERLRGFAIVGVCLLIGLLMIGAAAYQPIKDSINAREARSTAITDLGAPASACGKITTKKASGNQEHIPETEKGGYTDSPPAFGPHWNIWESMDKKFYTEQERPPLEKLVHNMEHGFTILWYDETIAGDSAQLDDVKKIAEKYSGTDNLRLKFMAVPWTEDDGDPFPDGQHVALTHWSVGGVGEDRTGEQVGVWQYCSEPSGEAAARLHGEVPVHGQPGARRGATRQPSRRRTRRRPDVARGTGNGTPRRTDRHLVTGSCAWWPLQQPPSA